MGPEEDTGRQNLTFLPEGYTSVLCFLGLRCWGKKKKIEPIVKNGPLALPRGQPHLCLMRGWGWGGI